MNSLAQFKDNTVCIMGLGYVGLTLATVMAEVGYRVYGVEIRADVLEKLNRGEPHFFEPGMKERLGKVLSEGRISFSTHITEVCPASVYIITVGTPLNAEGRVRLDMIEAVSKEVAKKMKDGDMVILRSTVKVGTTRRIVLPLLAERGISADVAFCPERTLEGRALSELRQLPQIVGATSMSGAVRAAQVFQFLTPTVVRVSDIETAEMVKLIDNSYRNLTLGFGNEVARICDALSISAIEVIRAGKLGYGRTDVALPGPVGGPCLEKDPYILAESLEPYNVSPELTLGSRKIHERQPVEVAEFLKKQTSSMSGFPTSPVIAMLGFAFKGKPATDDLRGTMAYPIMAALRKQFPTATYKGFDPMITGDILHKEFQVEGCESLQQALQGANLVVIMNNHATFETMPIEQLAETLARPALFYDYWNYFTMQNFHLPAGVGYIAVGSHGKGTFGTTI